MKHYSNCLILFLIALIACENKSQAPETPNMSESQATPNFGEDISFLQNYISLIILKDSTGESQVAISPELQARVMSSSSQGNSGNSYGWINRPLFESGDTLEHINPFGGEERFWLGPEGGQFSVFFQQGKEFTLEDWQTPKLIDLDNYEVDSQSEKKAEFSKSAILTNYSGFTFEFEIKRSISILEKREVYAALGLSEGNGLKVVGYRTDNSLKNTGNTSWEKETGLLSIWLLGMFNPSPQTTVIIPFVAGEESEIGPIVNDTYFGKVPADRLKIDDGVLFFKGDGQFRSKIGLSPKRSKPVLGAYDAGARILTIVTYDKAEGVLDYVNSLWEIQEEPYKGDVINSYNDGPPSPGAKPLGPFYELETSSPALALKPEESGSHFQTTIHLEGPEGSLDQVAQKVLGVSLAEVKAAFP